MDSWPTTFLTEEAEGRGVCVCVCVYARSCACVQGTVASWRNNKELCFQIPNILIFGKQKQIKIASSSQSLKLLLKYFHPFSYSCYHAI